MPTLGAFEMAPLLHSVGWSSFLVLTSSGEEVHVFGKYQYLSSPVLIFRPFPTSKLRTHSRSALAAMVCTKEQGLALGH